MKQTKAGWLFFLYFLGILITVGYTFAHIDLNLTLSSNPFYQKIQQQLIDLAYFHRPVSTAIFVSLLLMLFGFWYGIVWLVRTNRINRRSVWTLIGISFLLIAAYPAFSHDVFNYLFDARIVTQYGLDPHYFKALDFPLDPWIRFMRWTHRYYPYGPSWLLLSLIPSFLGMGKFVLTLFLCKGMMAAFHLLNCFLVEKLAGGKESKLGLISLAIFALHPLTLIESLITPHNEVVMLTGILLGLVLLKKPFLSVGSFIVAAGIKYISVLLLPLVLLSGRLNKDRLFNLAFWLSVLAIIPLLISREPYSWYFLPPFALSLFIKNNVTKIVMTAVAGAVLLRYIPFFLYGDYGYATIQLQFKLLIIGFLIFSLLEFITSRKMKLPEMLQ